MAIDLGYVTLPDSQLVWRLFHWHNTFQIVLYATAGGGGGQVTDLCCQHSQHMTLN